MLERCAEVAGQRMRDRFAALGRPPGPADVVRICLTEVLPTDDDSLLLSRVRAGQAAGTVAAAVDAQLEGRGLAALAAGLASTMLVGGRTAAEAVELVEYHVDRLFKG